MYEVYEQLSLFPPPPVKPFPCDTCGYEVKWCCNYPETPNDFCVMGDKWRPRRVVKS